MQKTQIQPGSSSTTLLPFLKLFLFAAIILLIADSIGTITVNVGPGKVVLLPMIWAILIGGAWGLSAKYLPSLVRVDLPMQHRAAAVLQPALLIFIAKLGLMVGNSLPQLASAGWALIFQEVGHFVGTILVALPVALLLGIKREAIGATFSVGREPSLAIIGEKYGMNSPEGRGVLAEYITGTLFGAIFIAILAGFLASLNIFDPIALAMGSGVGSGSMMAAAAGAIASLQSPEVAKDVMTFAAASNLITTTIGTYFTLFLSLPLAAWAYRTFEPIIGRTTKASLTPSKLDAEHVDFSVTHVTYAQKFLIWVVAALFTMLTDALVYGSHPSETFAGMLIVLGAVIAGDLVARLFRSKVPVVCCVSILAMALTSPWCPWSAEIIALSGKVNFMSATPVMLTFAGLSLAKDIPAFRRLGWRIILVSFLANAGTFLGASLVAQFFHH